MKKKSFTIKSTDYSGIDSFSFGFFCDRCGKKKWESPVIPFMSSEFNGVGQDEARQLQWKQLHQVAFDQANTEAVSNFNQCRVCGKWVCDDCFSFEPPYLCVCQDCKGKPIASIFSSVS